MKGADSRLMMLALRAWCGEDDRNAGRIAEYVIEKALAGHVGFFRLLLDMVDGPLPKAADMARESGCTVALPDDEPVSDSAKAA